MYVCVQTKVLSAFSCNFSSAALTALSYVFFYTIYFYTCSLPLCAVAADLHSTQKEFENFNYACNENYEKPQNSFFFIDFYLRSNAGYSRHTHMDAFVEGFNKLTNIKECLEVAKGAARQVEGQRTAYNSMR